ncbi:ATP-binding protein [Geminicoccus roseus]|uniref:ATP-binding protein n=1 Tax=Geminicoccus roseus TaxID=404900 RepID=UPI0004051C77|nr:ATP-binding protein [Geminicoccus roseus]
MARRITFTIESDLAQVALAAAALRGVCGLVVLDPEALDELELGFVEAVNNVIEHGFAERAGMPILITVELLDDRVAIRIADQGTSIPPELLERARSAPFEVDPDDLDSLPESGMGLRLIMHCADKITYTVKDGINYLLLEKLLPA